MRILHVTYIFPPKPNVADGITRVVYGITRTLAKKGHDVSVYASNALDLHGKGRTEIDNSPGCIDEVKVRYFPYLLRYGTIFFTPSMFYSVRDDIKEFDVVHIHDARCLQCAITTYYAELFNIPIVFQPHGSFKSPLPSGRLRKLSRLFIDKLFAEKVFKKASKIVALSQMEAQQYRGMGVPEEKIAVIPNGIDLSEYGDLPPKGSFKKKFGIDDGEKVILYLGRIHKTKGIDFMVKAYAYLVKNMKCNEAVLVIAGPDDGYLAEAKSLAGSLSISDHVLFTGFVSSEDKLKGLVDADVFVTPSFYGFPVTFLEACATGTPIVTTTLGDTLEWIDGNAGYVTPPIHHDLAKTIYTIISDDELRRKLSRNCMKIVKSKFSLEKVVDTLEQVYGEVAEGKVL